MRLKSATIERYTLKANIQQYSKGDEQSFKVAILEVRIRLESSRPALPFVGSFVRSFVRLVDLFELRRKKTTANTKAKQLKLLKTLAFRHTTQSFKYHQNESIYQHERKRENAFSKIATCPQSKAC